MAQIQEFPERLVAFEEFAGLWARFVERLRPLVAAVDAAAWTPEDARLAAVVAEVDDLRLDLYGRQSTGLGVYKDPLSTILRTSLRVPTITLYELFGREGHPTIGPIRVMNLVQFDATVAESKALIDERRRELQAELHRLNAQAQQLYQAIQAQRAHELERLERENWSFKGLWKRLTRNPLGKVLTWSVVTLAGGILLYYGVPALVHLVAGIWARIRAHV